MALLNVFAFDDYIAQPFVDGCRDVSNNDCLVWSKSNKTLLAVFKSER